MNVTEYADLIIMIPDELKIPPVNVTANKRICERLQKYS